MADRYDLRLPALQVRQGEHLIYSFAVDGKILHSFAAVSRVHREQTALRGYQRPEVLSHIKAIRRYLESPAPMLPNAIVLAFHDKSTRFEPYRRRALVDYATPGDLIIAIDEAADEADKPAWIVDGQQRSAAIRDADLNEFPLPVVGFIATEEQQRSQFILVNNTKPLPKGLIHELLPDTVGHLPPVYARRQLPALLLSRLNNSDLFSMDDDSPFQGRIQTPTAPNGYIKDNSVIRMIEHSLSDGALYQYRNSDDHSGDVEQMLLHLKIFWNLTRAVFTDAWDLPPRRSRLTHGVGIQAMGFVMDALTENTPALRLPQSGLDSALIRLSAHCAWTTGQWRLSEDVVRPWNSLQNTPTDVKLLTNFLLRKVAK